MSLVRYLTLIPEFAFDIVLVICIFAEICGIERFVSMERIKFKKLLN